MPIREQIKLDVCVVVDTSESLENYAHIIRNSLGNMVKKLRISNKEDALTGYDVFFTLCCFSDDEEKKIWFEPLKNANDSSIENIKFAGQTNPAPAINSVVDEAIRRYENWRAKDQKCARPLFYFFTDGNPYPTEKYEASFKRAAKNVSTKEEQGKILSVVAGCGNVNDENLKCLTHFPSHVIRLENNSESIADYFSRILPQTTNNAVTTSMDQRFAVGGKSLFKD